MCRSVESLSLDRDEMLDYSEAEMEETGYLFTLENYKSKQLRTVTILLSGKPVEFRIDTSVNVMVILKELFESFNKVTLDPTR